MRAVVQRVNKGSVSVPDENYYSSINKGLVILLGINDNDIDEDINFVADKCCNLRVFNDGGGIMNLSLKDIAGEILIISQFTLYGDTRKGNRPSYISAARPEKAEKFYEKFIERIKSNLGSENVKTGIFGAMMNVEIINDGPVTLIVESK